MVGSSNPSIVQSKSYSGFVLQSDAIFILRTSFNTSVQFWTLAKPTKDRGSNYDRRRGML